jgi:UDP-N-acetylmuramate: L-alanyl-gamma-D-glutamyl-meso-diaminopimelate ligase
MRLGVHRNTLAGSLSGADEVWLYAPSDLGWDARAAVAPLGTRAHIAEGLDDLLSALLASAHRGDHVLIMSNGGFGGLHQRLLRALAQALPMAGEATRVRGA